ncbi:Zn-dependent hydrolase [Salinicoccus albus]|uniref:Zn-dependent hydrolase n=1 Tax=Salinicoccus albus TaxID=418756 RepID=UPI000375E08E|nr:Zn-dependent hydrolase [Salinicoccus albus]
MKINLNRMMDMLSEVNQITDEGEGVTRPAFSDFEDQAHGWFINKCKAHGLETYQDRFGNSFATIGPGEEKGLLIGSHLDTVNNGGEYDGALGVITALETVITLLENGVELSKPVTVVAFRAEEIGLIGSSVFSDLIDKSGNFAERMAGIGRTPEDVENAIGYKDFTDYLELHIEQGVYLENNALDIGIVNAIASMHQLNVTVFGEAGHAGTIGMRERDDAMMNASKLLVEFEKIVKSYGPPFVGTAGTLEVFPNSSNVIPGKVEFTVEVRGDDMDKLHAILDSFIEYAERDFKTNITKSIDKAPAHMSDGMIDAITAACEATDMKYELMMSGANHDANPLSRRMNAGMIFIPSKDGISHNPREFSSKEDIETGAAVMLEAVKRLLSK